MTDVATTANGLPDLEPVISDWEMSVVEGRLREAWLGTVPDETAFVSFIQEPRDIEREGRVYHIDRMAVFGVLSPHPTNKLAPSIFTHGTVSYEAFDEERKARKHYASTKPDPALVIMAAVLKNHMETLSNLREIIH